MSDNIEVASVDDQAQTVVNIDGITIGQECNTEMIISGDNIDHNEKSPADTVNVNEIRSSTIVDNKITQKSTLKPTNNSNSLLRGDADSQQVELPNESDMSTSETVPTQKNIVQDMKQLDIADESETIVVINKQSNSLKNLMNYDSSDSNSEDSEDDSEGDSSSADSESDSNTTVEVSSGDDDDCDVEEVAVLNRKNVPNINKVPTTADILDPVDFSLLPDLKKLDINYEKEEFLQMGHVKAIILDTVVTVEALPGVPAYNLDTILFMKDSNDQQQHPLGVVDDVIGPVESPLYCLRFQTAEELKEKGVIVGKEVYVAPKNDCTKYVFIKELMKIKGSDASWIGDKELPPEMAEESDEEVECDADAVRKAPKRKCGPQQDPTRTNSNNFNPKICGRPRRGFQRAPVNFPPQPPIFNEHEPTPNYNPPAHFDPTQPPPTLPPPMHPAQGPWMPPPPPMGGPRYGPHMMRGGPFYPPRHYGPFGPGPIGPRHFGPGPSGRPF